jgi:hypothetical protein
MVYLSTLRYTEGKRLAAGAASTLLALLKEVYIKQPSINQGFEPSHSLAALDR